MKKEQDKEQLIKEYGTEYINSFLAQILGREKNHSQKATEFSQRLSKIDEKNEQALFDHYSYIAYLFTCFQSQYFNSIAEFEKTTLQINSIISTSLTIEQHINDIKYGNDLLLRAKLTRMRRTKRRGVYL